MEKISSQNEKIKIPSEIIEFCDKNISGQIIIPDRIFYVEYYIKK